MQHIRLFVLASGMACIGTTAAYAQSQYPIMDRVAERVIQKYQTSSPQQIAAQRAQHPSGRREEMEQRVVQLLHQDPQMREAFLDRVAAPIANKLFECGAIP